MTCGDTARGHGLREETIGSMGSAGNSGSIASMVNASDGDCGSGVLSGGRGLEFPWNAGGGGGFDGVVDIRIAGGSTGFRGRGGGSLPSGTVGLAATAPLAGVVLRGGSFAAGGTALVDSIAAGCVGGGGVPIALTQPERTSFGRSTVNGAVEIATSASARSNHTSPSN